MDLLECLRMSWRSIVGHKLRSTLTTLGVIIGVAAVIAFVTLGASLQADIVNTIAGNNQDVMYVSASSQTQGDIPQLGQGGQAVFTQYDVDQIRQVEGVAAAVPVGGIATAQVRYRNDSVGRQWVTVSRPQYFELKGQQIVEGRAFRPGQREVVLNRPAAQMFAENVTVGENITLTRAANGQPINATVVGIAETSQDGAGALTGGAQPSIYGPTNPFYERTVISPNTQQQQRVYSQVLVSAGSIQEIEAVQGRIISYLTERSDARVLKAEGYQFEVTTYDQLVDQIRQVSSTFTAYITGIAVISLVVGAIGIANIMLVSVTERTREIGIMKAVGAKRRDIMELFLLEAILLGLFGSVFGALVGISGGYAATVLIDLPLRIRPLWFVVAVVVGPLVGVFAGLYPAWSASTVDPIDALRHE
ncbi:ABC transporter permease [Haloprofundus salinisoli]|uniref:ABC transporter permease n=1 Tax=Haloprofundus salinisoli TaxID=2876193 RepID=UPI001CC9FDA7|nr:ABC transporter permease [Haloprofundus salinisoli]